jgi:(1->4)-alpha-D-glucan 1-alpha-D-glucosylmutase
MRIPTATYRLQFTPEFGFRKARSLLGYLRELGISDLYASPIFRARKGSTHGYDVVDHGELNPELGTAEDFAALSDAVRQRGMGWLQDIVPNHMAFCAQNPLLVDLLENGEGSPYRRFFDIDWEHYYEGIHGKVLAPFLGSFFGRALENGELRLRLDEDGFSVTYFDLRFPLRIESYLSILDLCVPPLGEKLGEEHPDYVQLLGILYVLKTLRGNGDESERHSQVVFVKQTLRALHRRCPEIRRAIDRAVRRLNGRSGRPESFNALEGLLSEQLFRLSFWKVATEEINYRRFFSINDLISLRAEEEEVFERTHGLVLQLVAEGRLNGLRVDHIDGLYDPAAYLGRLREKIGGTYLVVEKILGDSEELPSWPAEGTTGYDFLVRVNALFVRPENEKVFTLLYRRFTGREETCSELTYEKKRLIIERHMFGDVNNLAHLLKNIASRHRDGSDITMDSLKRTLIEVMALFPVYRSYVGPEGASEEDRRSLSAAIGQARERNPALLNELGFLEKICLLRFDAFLPEEERAQWRHFVMRLQQFTGPLMAKGFEDTLLYVYNRLLSLNEVGGEPERFGRPAEELHAWFSRRRQRWPHALSATATHDTKRGEDVRARLNVLSELPQEWRQQLQLWSRLNRGKKRLLRRRKVPERNDECFLYQTLLGAWPWHERELPDFRLRLREYLVKAVREAKVHTAWLKPDTDYEEAYLAFAEKLLSPGRGDGFLKAFLPFQKKVARFGVFNSLAQTLIKLTAPGVPDLYQGTELWDLSLVDPDNRRPVDYSSRRQALREIRAGEKGDLPALARQLLAHPEDGRLKLFLIHRALLERSGEAELFRDGDYLELAVEGARRENLFAFARRKGGRWALTVVPRFVTDLVEEGGLPLGEEVWGDTRLVLPGEAPALWREAIAGAEVEGEGGIGACEALRRFPVALLVGGE